MARAPLMSLDCIPKCVAAIERLRKEKTNNVLYLLADALTQERPECRLSTKSKAFKLINLILLSMIEPDLSKVQKGSTEFLDNLDVILWNGELCLPELNDIIFPTSRYYYELTQTGDKQQTIVLKESKLKEPKEEPEDSFDDGPMETHEASDEEKQDTSSFQGTGKKATTETVKKGNSKVEIRDSVQPNRTGKKADTKTVKDRNSKVETESTIKPQTDKKAKTKSVQKIKNSKVETGNSETGKKVNSKTVKKRKIEIEIKGSAEISEAGDQTNTETLKQRKIEVEFEDNSDGQIKVSGQNLSMDNFVFDPAIQCESCKRVFPSEAAKTEHTKQGYCLSCVQCQVTFASPSVYCQHLREVHKTNVALCVMCHQQFDDTKNCLVHLWRCVTEMRKYPCEICRKRFADHQARREHHLTCTWKPCQLCPAKFAKLKPLREHYTKAHEKFMCLHCVTPFDSQFLWSQHMRQNHYQIPPKRQLRITICDICGRKTASNYSLRKHKERMHVDRASRPLFPCEVCGLKLLSKATRRTHMRKLHNGGDTQYPCAVCGKLVSRSNETEHRALHEGTLRFMCTVCNEGFIHRVPYKRHIFRHLGTKLFPCKLCSHTYDTPDLIRDHIRRFHKNHTLVMENISFPSTNVQKDPVKFDFSLFARENSNMTLKFCAKSGGEPIVANITLPSNIPLPVASTSDRQKSPEDSMVMARSITSAGKDFQATFEAATTTRTVFTRTDSAAVGSSEDLEYQPGFEVIPIAVYQENAEAGTMEEGEYQEELVPISVYPVSRKGDF